MMTSSVAHLLLKFQEWQPSLAGELQDFYFNEKFADLTIVGCNGSLKCHRIVMTTLSEFISQLLNLDEFGTKTDSLILPDFTVEDIRVLLEFLYGMQPKMSASFQLLLGVLAPASVVALEAEPPGGQELVYQLQSAQPTTYLPSTGAQPTVSAVYLDMPMDTDRALVQQEEMPMVWTHHSQPVEVSKAFFEAHHPNSIQKMVQERLDPHASQTITPIINRHLTRVMDSSMMELSPINPNRTKKPIIPKSDCDEDENINNERNTSTPNPETSGNKVEINNTYPDNLHSVKPTTGLDTVSAATAESQVVTLDVARLDNEVVPPNCTTIFTQPYDDKEEPEENHTVEQTVFVPCESDSQDNVDPDPATELEEKSAPSGAAKSEPDGTDQDPTDSTTQDKGSSENASGADSKSIPTNGKKCPGCGELLIQHAARLRERRHYVCCQCGKIYRCLGDLQTHWSNGHKEHSNGTLPLSSQAASDGESDGSKDAGYSSRPWRFSCSFCCKPIDEHIDDEDGTLACCHCSEKFENMSQIYLHIKDLFKQSLYDQKVMMTLFPKSGPWTEETFAKFKRCSECPRRKVSSLTLKRHIRLKHSHLVNTWDDADSGPTPAKRKCPEKSPEGTPEQRKLWECAKCGRSYMRVENLMKHTRTAHKIDSEEEEEKFDEKMDSPNAKAESVKLEINTKDSVVFSPNGDNFFTVLAGEGQGENGRDEKVMSKEKPPDLVVDEAYLMEVYKTFEEKKPQ